VCRELTKLHEEVVRGTAAELAARFSDAPKGELVLVLDALAGEGVEPAAVAAALAELRERGLGAKDAARLVASLTGQSTRDLYRP
jgi:16S rRNA (cytidine1402-2'-O)-methyltransferase